MFYTTWEIKFCGNDEATKNYYIFTNGVATTTGAIINFTNTHQIIIYPRQMLLLDGLKQHFQQLFKI